MTRIGLGGVPAVLPGGRVSSRVAVATVLLLSLGCRAGPSPVDGSYDVYILGVPAATLEVDGDSYRIRKKDLAANRWGDWVSASVETVAEDDRFRLWGAVADLPARLQSLARIDWTSLESVGWPDAATIWLRYEA